MSKLLFVSDAKGCPPACTILLRDIGCPVVLNSKCAIGSKIHFGETRESDTLYICEVLPLPSARVSSAVGYIGTTSLPDRFNRTHSLGKLPSSANNPTGQTCIYAFDGAT
jgi:hypothetical protein